MSVLERLLGRDGPEKAVVGDLSLAPMRRRDLRGGVMAIEAVSYPRPWSQAVFESEISQMRSGTRQYLVARRSPVDSNRARGPVVGYAGLWFAAGEAHVTNVAVAAAEQRRGVASALLVGLADEAIRRGCTAWTLEVRVTSTGAQELYRSFGFAPAGIRTRYYENTEDAIVMWCHDIQSDAYATVVESIRTKLAR